ncbi:MAG: FtsX-like permease family protein [Phycisphaerales bacterium]|nr:MAG: FtsX-like permease family protein [Phycisphaerales bacterium]
MGGNVATALVQVWANKIRSLLTVLGIIIAVLSIITVVSFTQGFGDYVSNFLRGLGTNLMFVRPQWIRGHHGEFIRRAEMSIDDVIAADVGSTATRRTAPALFIGGVVEYGRRQVSDVQIVGSSEAYQPVRNFYTDEGRFITAVEVADGAAVCVLGREVLRKLECDERIVGDYVLIDSQRFKVVGLFEAKGSFMGDNLDELVVIPWTAAVRMYPERKHYFAFFAEAVGEEQIEEASAQIAYVLRQRHGIQPGMADDFRVSRQDQLLEEFGRMRMVATSVLAGIVSISLLVGGIGIMNVMLVSVTERTREIGLRKSVGARRRDILLQFLTEAVVLSTLGGGIGVTIGYSICFVANLHPSMVEVNVPAWSVGLALAFSAGVGVFFGIIPAFKAAILHPIDALRHE